MSLGDRVRKMVEAQGRGDIDAVREHYVPDAEWVTSPTFLLEDTAIGRENEVPLRGLLHGVTTFRWGEVARVEMLESRADAERAAGPLRE